MASSAFSYVKAIVRPSTEYISVFWKYLCRSEKPDRIDKSPALYQLVYNYFISPVEILDNVYLGNILNSSNYEQLKDYNIDVIFNMTAEHACYFPGEFEYHQLSISDLKNASLGSEFDKMVDILDTVITNQRTVLVHCHHGRSRSVSLIIGYLMKHHDMTFNEAYNLVKTKKPIIGLNVDFKSQLINLYSDHE